jgi:hypothetical protein
MSDIYLWTNGFIYNLIFLIAFLAIVVLLKFKHPYAEKTKDAFVQAFLISVLLMLISVISCICIASQFSMSDKGAYSIFLVFTDSPYLIIAIFALAGGNIVEKVSRGKIKWKFLGVLVALMSFAIIAFLYYSLIFG